MYQSPLLMQDVEISEDGLRGEALLDRSSQLLRRFPEGELPMTPAERFDALWAAQPRWPAQDIEPYVAGLQVLLYFRDQDGCWLPSPFYFCRAVIIYCALCFGIIRCILDGKAIYKCLPPRGI